MTYHFDVNAISPARNRKDFSFLFGPAGNKVANVLKPVELGSDGDEHFDVVDFSPTEPPPAGFLRSKVPLRNTGPKRSH